MIRIGPRIGPAIGPWIGGDGGGVAPTDTTLSVSIVDSVDPVISLVNFTYSVVVTNTGAIDATGVEAIIELDSSLAFVSAAGTGWATGAVGQVVTCTRATLAPGAAPTITVTVTSPDLAGGLESTADAFASNVPVPPPQDVELTTVNLVDRDATSLIRCPSSLTQWQDFAAYHVAIGTVDFPNVTPTSLWLCHEASGNLIDVIGGVTLTLAGAGHLFQQTVTGWSRKAVQTVDGTSGQKWINSTTASNPNTTDTIMFAYLGVPAGSPAVSRDVMGKATTDDLRFNSTGRLRPTFGAAADMGTDNRGTVVFAANQVNNTGAVSACYTSTDKHIGTYALPASAPLSWLGGQTALASGMQYLLAGELTGAGGRLTSAQMKSFITALGFAPPWAP